MNKARKKNTRIIESKQTLGGDLAIEKIFPDMVMSLPELYRALINMTQLLERETVALKAMNLQDVRAIQSQKEVLTDVLEKFNNWLRTHPQLLEDFPRAERLALRQLMARFREELQKNHRELSKHHLVQQRVLKLIHRAVIENDPLKDAYKRNGKLQSQQGDKGNWFSHLAVSLDENI